MSQKVITVASVIPSANANPQHGIAGAAITEGMIIYLDTSVSPNVWKPYSATQANQPTSVAFALNRAAVGQTFCFTKADPALQPGFAITAGETVIAGATTGAINDDADALSGWTKFILGGGNAGGTLNFNPLKVGAVP